MVLCLSNPKREKVANHLSIVAALVDSVEKGGHGARRNCVNVIVVPAHLERLLDISHWPASGVATVHILQCELGLVLKENH